MGPNTVCTLCMNVPKKNSITKINALPKTFKIILEEMSGRRFNRDSLEMVICMKCLDFLKNLDNSSTTPKSNKISEAGKKRVFKLMEKRRIPAAEAIEIVLAEQRAKELLKDSGLRTGVQGGELVPAGESFPNTNLVNPRLSGAQRKKVSILIDAGMDSTAARQLIYAATLAKRAANNEIVNQVSNVQAPSNERQGLDNNRGPRSRQPRGPPSQREAGQRKQLPQPQSRAAKPVQKPPVQQVASARPVQSRDRAVAKDPRNGTSIKKPATVSSGVLVPPTKRSNRSRGGRGGNNSDTRVGPAQHSRANDRPAPYDRHQNRSQQQSNFNQQINQNTSIEVGIVPINYPDAILDELKLDALKEAITNEILKIPQGGPLIRFLGTSSQNGWLKIICADQVSYNWLGMLVSRWERAGVRMVDADTVPRVAFLSFYLESDFRTPDEIFSIIEKQNNFLNAKDWRVINRESDRNGQRITICVDEHGYNALRNRDFMVFLGLGVVELKPRTLSSSDNSSSQNFRGNDDRNFSNSSGNNMQGGRGGGDGGGMNNMNGGYNNYQSMDFGRDNGYDNANYQNQRQGYQRNGYQSQRAW